MTTQQKIEFYLKNGFAVKCNWEGYGPCESIYYFKNETGDFVGQDTENKQTAFWSKRQCDPDTIIPIPPKPYEFNCGERVMLLDNCDSLGIDKEYSSQNYIIKRVKEDLGYVIENERLMWNVNITVIAPALPEDEECEVIEVVKIPEFYINELNLTKPDGKKLKIKVIKK